MCTEEDELYDGPCYSRPPIIALTLFTCIAVGVTALALSSYDTYEVRHFGESKEVLIDAMVRPQFYAVSSNQRNATHVPSSIIMVRDDHSYGRAYCSYYPLTTKGDFKGNVELSYIVQAEIDFSEAFAPERIEFRYEVPYGTQLPMLAHYRETRCPPPDCGFYDYREDMGEGFAYARGLFLGAHSVYLNRRELLDVPITCGCTTEPAPRFSCIMPSSKLHGLKGALMITSTMHYYSGMEE